jgi:hypothetical protein
MDALCWTEPFVWHGQCYDITVSRQTGGKCYTAETVLGPGDKVISDGRSVEDAVEQLRDVLPVGVWRLVWRLLLGHPEVSDGHPCLVAGACWTTEQRRLP